MNRYAVNGIELDVVEAGDPAGPAIVLAHGFPESSHSWRHQIEPLVAAGYHVLAPDQRGYGRSSAPKDVSAYGIEHLCGDLLGLLDATGHDDAVFVGHDWGALLVWDLARIHPERVRAPRRPALASGLTRAPVRRSRAVLSGAHARCCPALTRGPVRR